MSMIPKAELQAKCDELEKQLRLIYKYAPSLRDLEGNIKVLQSLGLDERSIKDVICKGSTAITKSITNPLTGEEIAIYVESISVKEDAGGYDVFIGGVPYREFFTENLLTTKKLEELSQDNPEVKVIYEENQKLKSLLAQLGKKV